MAKSKKRMTAERELELIHAAKGGDNDAMMQLYRYHAGMRYRWLMIARSSCYDYHRMDFDDMNQELYLLFDHAVKMFDTTTGYRLISYLSQYMAVKLMRIATANGVVALPAAPCTSCRIKVRRQWRAAYGPIEYLRSGDDSRYNLAGSPPLDIECQEVLAKLKRGMRFLPKRMQFIVRRRIRGDTLDRIAKRLKVTRERVRQIEGKAALRLMNVPFMAANDVLLDN